MLSTSYTGGEKKSKPSLTGKLKIKNRKLESEILNKHLKNSVANSLQKAGSSLQKELANYGYSEEARKDLKNRYCNMNGFEHMNKKYLAGSIYLNDVLNTENRQLMDYDFSDSSYIMQKILGNVVKNSEDLKKDLNYITSVKAQILAYYYCLLSYNTDFLAEYDVVEQDEE